MSHSSYGRLCYISMFQYFLFENGFTEPCVCVCACPCVCTEYEQFYHLLPDAHGKLLKLVEPQFHFSKLKMIKDALETLKQSAFSPSIDFKPLIGPR